MLPGITRVSLWPMVFQQEDTLELIPVLPMCDATRLVIFSLGRFASLDAQGKFGCHLVLDHLGAVRDRVRNM